jgi:transposase-like protein
VDQAETVPIESADEVGIEVPSDHKGTFEPQIVKKHRRRPTGMDEIVLSLYAAGLTTGKISGHFAEIYGASVPKGTVSRTTGRVIEELQAPQATSRPSRPPECLYLVTGSLDPTGDGKTRWAMRWKPALNAFAITFADRFPALRPTI